MLQVLCFRDFNEFSGSFLLWSPRHIEGRRERKVDKNMVERRYVQRAGPLL